MSLSADRLKYKKPPIFWGLFVLLAERVGFTLRLRRRVLTCAFGAA